MQQALRASMEDKITTELARMQQEFDGKLMQQTLQLQQQSFMIQQQSCETAQHLQQAHLQQQALQHQQLQMRHAMEQATQPVVESPRRKKSAGVETHLLSTPQAPPQVLQPLQVMDSSSAAMPTVPERQSIPVSELTPPRRSDAAVVPTSPLTVEEVSALPVAETLHVRREDDSTTLQSFDVYTTAPSQKANSRESSPGLEDNEL